MKETVDVAKADDVVEADDMAEDADDDVARLFPFSQYFFTW